VARFKKVKRHKTQKFAGNLWTWLAVGVLERGVFNWSGHHITNISQISF
jgi:hypothetical protein